MISVHEAIQIIVANSGLLSPRAIPLTNVSGLILAEDVIAPVNVPAFCQAAMDGYAFRYADLEQAKNFCISEEVAAGDFFDQSLPSHHAVRIFTGAAVPECLDTVVMKEKTSVNCDELCIEDDQLNKGKNVRTEGSEIRKGELALKAGTTFTPAAIGFLASLGYMEVRAYPEPVVHIIITGNELQQPGHPLKPGLVYESNSVMLQSALHHLHLRNTTVLFSADNLTEVQSAISASLAAADLVLVTGGVSEGSYDFVVQAAGSLGVKKLFHKVKQRPGKPLYAGIKDQKILFGLPGNPASVLSCFYVYVCRAIEGLTGRKNLVRRQFLRLRSSCSKKVQMTQFLKAYSTKEGVWPLHAQESYRLSSFAVANSLIVLPENQSEFSEGETVETLIIHY